jgi:methylaspartate mutase epsilon subunit
MSNKSGHTILLGGIGGDSHSVGLTILRQALLTSGYRVRYLGTQNRLEDFFQLASMANVVMISSMDGHVNYYLREFPELMKRYAAHVPQWYLGGNLHIGDAHGYERHFLEMGFNRVFVKFVDIRSVLQTLERDLDNIDPAVDFPTLWEQYQPPNGYLAAPVADDMMELSDLKRDRPEVLESWKTGHKAKHIEENAEFLGRQPSFSKLQESVHNGQHPLLVQPRSGVPVLRRQIKLFQTFKSVGAQVLSYQVDSLTRNNNYTGADEAIRESEATGVSTLNGFPVVNHGVGGLRKVVAAVKLPLQTRHSTRDPRLLAEISYAGGVTSYEGGAICYNIPYYKDYPLDESVRRWQYVDRLTGLYYERFGIRLDREFFGTLTATLIPPSLAIAVNVLEAILAIRQGVKCVSLGYAEQGNRAQDIAAIRTLRRIAETYIRNLGYKDVQVATVFHQYMAAFPETHERAAELIYNSAISSALSGATRVIIKTAVESIRIPSLEDNVHAINLVKQGIAAAGAEWANETLVAEECDIIGREVEAILGSIIVCGGGSFAEGIVKGFRLGYLDVPFSPSVHNRGEVMTARDTEGAVRFLSCGNLQFDRELRDFHRSKMEDRRRAEGLYSEKQNYLLVEQDVLQIARGQYEQWPLSSGQGTTTPPRAGQLLGNALTIA